MKELNASKGYNEPYSFCLEYQITQNNKIVYRDEIWFEGLPLKDVLCECLAKFNAYYERDIILYNMAQEEIDAYGKDPDSFWAGAFKAGDHYYISMEDTCIECSIKGMDRLKELIFVEPIIRGDNHDDKDN